MSSKEVYNVLKELDVCAICMLRHLNVRCNEFDDIQLAYKNRDIEVPADQIDCDEPDIKRSKSNVCIECLGLFQNDYLNTIAKVIVETTELNSYECDTIYTSISVPILIQIRELALWIHLLKQLPGKISETNVPAITIKETFKYIMNTKLCKLTGKTLESNQNGILVNVFFDHDAEQMEIKRLDAIAPRSMKNNSKKKKHAPVMTRTLFEKNFYPENLDVEACINHLPVPPSTLSTPLKLVKCSIVGPTIFVAGRYRKLSRDLSQTPWILDGKRIKCNSLQEIIAHEVAPYFGINIDTNSEKVVFMSSGREDIDVRCLGRGRPFVLEIQDAKKLVLPARDAANIELKIDESKLVSVQHLQITKREDLVHIKSGEEEKRKFYRAHCVLQQPVTVHIMQKLNIPDGFLIQQKTPLRVLHRRPLLTRPRQIYSVKGYLEKDNPRTIILDVVTQAGTYVKELIHGEFGRTCPSIASIIGQEIDIVALDVNAIELDWPPEMDNKLSLN